ncbi:tyrosyl-DNA phosphodiesterase 2 [Microdochium nivale]|nr:tyrosyl-DNA phosphodiesterase 2 [Microdochium nivale]
MDELFKKAVAANEAAKKPPSSVPWQPDVPYPQAYYSFDSATGTWEAQTPWRQQQGGDGRSSSLSGSTRGATRVTEIALYAWNIDFMLPFAEERMAAALAHLESLVSSSSSPSVSAGATETTSEATTTGVIIFLQECVESDLATIGKNRWVRENFVATDIVDGAMWASGNYGTTTLVSKNLLLEGCFRVHYDKTRMERDVLFVDFDVGVQGLGQGAEGAGQTKDNDNNNNNNNNNERRIIRVGNTHLESLALEPAYRPHQVELAARFMKSLDNDGGGGSSNSRNSSCETAVLHGAILAGDFNAIQDFDRTLHSDNGLRDAYVEFGGREDEGGHTWGQQAATVLRNRFGCSRMDKVYFCGGGLRLRRFDTFGEGVELQDGEQRRQLIELGFDRPWITDHLGVMTEFEICE